jgi:hypothetical protein
MCAGGMGARAWGAHRTGCASGKRMNALRSPGLLDCFHHVTLFHAVLGTWNKPGNMGEHKRKVRGYNKKV